MNRPTTASHYPQRGAVRGLVLAPLTLVVLCVLYVMFVLSWSYSTGERAGILQKFSHKGWVCKTWEGELAMTTVPGVAPTLWAFSVRDEAAAKRLEGAVGQKVVLHYDERKGIPTSCFGDTPYFVDNVSFAAPPPGQQQ